MKTNIDSRLERLAAGLSAAAVQDIALRAILVTILSGRDVTFDTVWASAEFAMPPQAQSHNASVLHERVRETIAATLQAAAMLRGGNS